jgi:choline dehydrogenase
VRKVELAVPSFTGLADARNPKWLLRWLIRRSGKLTSNLMEAVAHIRSAPGLPAPDFQLIYARIDELSYPRPALSILQSYWTPESRGSVLVRSPDPAVAPAIRLNTLAAAGDLATFVRAVRRTREIVSTEPLASAVGIEVHPGLEVNTDGELHAWIRGPWPRRATRRVRRRWAPTRTVCSTRSCGCGASRACAWPTPRRPASRVPTPMPRRS